MKVIAVILTWVLIGWVVISTLILTFKGGEAFFQDPSGTGDDQIKKYSPPFWRFITKWVIPFVMLALVIILVLSVRHGAQLPL